MKIIFSDLIKNACPDLVVGVLECEVVNSLNNEDLWKEISEESRSVVSSYKLDEINKRPEIAATRLAYKTLGKDPNRYRPSAEALTRRIVRGLPLYQINTVVDIINLVSIRSGFSIGGFDADKIQGNLELGVGKQDEPFEAIGRGMLNIDCLPVYRDGQGGIGTPTSDEERTKIGDTTSRLLMIVNAYSGRAGLEEAVHFAKELLYKYANMNLLHEEYIHV